MPDKSIQVCKPVIVPPDGGDVFRAFGDEVTVKLTGGQTGGAVSVISVVTPPGGGPPTHYHANEDEIFLVQQGRVQFFVNGEWIEPGEGSVVYVPRGSVHTFRIVGDSPCRMWVVAMPSGFEKFFSLCAAEFCRPGGPDMPKILDISADHGIHFTNA